MSETPFSDKGDAYGVPTRIGTYNYDLRFSVESPRPNSQDQESDIKSNYVKQSTLWTVLPLIVSTLLTISGYAIHLAISSKDLSYEAIAAAKAARPDAFRGKDALDMKKELIDRDNAIIARCAENIARLDKYDDKLDQGLEGLRKDIQAVEERCIARIHGFYPRNP